MTYSQCTKGDYILVDPRSGDIYGIYTTADEAIHSECNFCIPLRLHYVVK